MDLVAFVLNTVIGVILVGGTIGFLMQSEPPSAAVVNGLPDGEAEEPEPSPSVSPVCARSDEKCAGPSYAPPTRSS